MTKEKIETAREIVKEADAVLITAGAGMGVDSGLPDFRGVQGFWRAYPAAKRLNLRFEELANPRWFKEDPALAWAFYGHRLNLYRKTKPHKGFKLLLDLAKEKGGNYFVFTSNVDGHFQKAGFDKERIVEIHGTIHYLQCANRCTREVWEAPKEDIKIDMQNFKALTIPKCKNCGGVARVNILMFGDWEYIADYRNRQMNRLLNWLKSVETSGQKLAVIEIGAGLAVPTVRNFNEEVCSDYTKAKLIRINPREDQTPPKLGVGLHMGGLEALEKIVKS